MKLPTLLALALSFCALLGLGGCSTSSTAATSPAAKNTTTASSAASTPATDQATPKLEPGSLKGKKILVAYFSLTGTTQKVAEKLHQEIGGDLFVIKPAKPYPTDHDTASALAKKELAAKARPELSTKVDNMSQYDIIVLGYPIWWYTAPMAVNTFLESYDLTGKTILPFCTSGGFEVDTSVKDIRKLVGAKARVLDGLTANDLSTLEPWLKKSGLL